jgi:VWFA-related protein
LNRIRSRRALSALALAGLLVQVPVQAQAPSPAPVFETQLGVVSVDVVVLDKNGQPVQGLTEADFTITEDGARQQVTSFEAVHVTEGESVPVADAAVSTNAVRQRADRSFVIVLDDVHMTQPGLLLARTQIGKLLDALQPGDQVTLVPTGGGAWWSARLPEQRAELEQAFEAIKPLRVMDTSSGRISDWEAMTIYYGRDPSVLSVVARRWYENGLLAELPTLPRGENTRADLDISPGLPLIRSKATQQYQELTKRSEISLDVLERVASSLATQRGRKTVLVVSEGFVYDSTRPEFRALVRAARDANAVLSFFDARGSKGPNIPGNDAEFGRAIEERDRTTIVQNFSHDAEGSESVALDTGGSVWKGTDNLAEGMTKAVGESRTYYLLGYSSTNSKRDGKFRNIKVALARPGLDVRARKGYYAPQDQPEKKKAAADKLDPAVRTALDSPWSSDGLPLRLTSYVFGSGESGPATALLVAELDVRAVSFEEKAGRQVAALDTYTVVSPLSGGENKRVEKRADLSLPPEVLARLGQQGLPFMRDFQLAPGTYQARLLVRDDRSRKVGTVRHTFTVPMAKGLRTSTPILTDAVQAEGGAERPVPVAHRRFKSGSKLMYAFEIYGAGRGANGQSQVSVVYSIRRRDGGIFAEAPARPLAAPAGSPLAANLVLALTGAAPGEYDVVLTITDTASGEKLERRDAFVVEPPA